MATLGDRSAVAGRCESRSVDASLAGSRSHRYCHRQYSTRCGLGRDWRDPETMRWRHVPTVASWRDRPQRRTVLMMLAEATAFRHAR